jgi:hypothetical protein
LGQAVGGNAGRFDELPGETFFQGVGYNARAEVNTEGGHHYREHCKWQYYLEPNM